MVDLPFTAPAAAGSRRIEMKKSVSIVLLLVSALSFAVAAQKPSVYPAQGQSDEKKTADDAQCLAWAKQDTGVDPAAPAAAPQPTGPQGERLRGAVRGAAAGAVIGGVASGDSGKGAAVGATTGVLVGGRRARQNKAAQTEQAQAAQAQSIDRYYRAYGACMQGRGYTVE
jgi:Glycine-zipper domain